MGTFQLKFTSNESFSQKTFGQMERLSFLLTKLLDQINVAAQHETNHNRLLQNFENEISINKTASKIEAKPPWKCHDYQQEHNTCFLLMPFSENWSDTVRKIISKVAESNDLKCSRADENILAEKLAMSASGGLPVREPVKQEILIAKSAS